MRSLGPFRRKKKTLDTKTQVGNSKPLICALCFVVIVKRPMASGALMGVQWMGSCKGGQCMEMHGYACPKQSCYEDRIFDYLRIMKTNIRIAILLFAFSFIYDTHLHKQMHQSTFHRYFLKIFNFSLSSLLYA